MSRTREEVTRLEREIILLTARGQSGPMVAKSLGISETTVNNVLRRIRDAKGKLTTTGALVAMAMDGELPELEAPREEANAVPETPVQRAIMSRLVVSSLDWRDFRDLRQAYEVICRQGV